MAKKAKARKVIVVIKFPNAVPDLIFKSRSIVSKLTGNAKVPLPYPSNTPDLTTCSANIDALEQIETDTLTKALGKADDRDVALELVKRNIRAYRAMVQLIVDDTPDYDTAVALVISTGFEIKKVGSRKTIVFNVKNTNIPGNIDLQAAGIKNGKGAHEWYYSADTVNYTNPVYLPSTPKAKTKASGLIPGTRYAFFHIAIDGNVETVLDGPVFLMVI